ncbi:MAG TPA: Tudor-knot domain-containing protein [Gemmataceae bacterium]|nr:Tudor-knot domain-containing protein [Gemmataceae bacterium]
MSKFILTTGLLLGSLASLGAVAQAGPVQGRANAMRISAVAHVAYFQGEQVYILWEGKWYPGEILAVYNGRGTYKVHYEGYGSEWDEEVGSDRLSPM